MKSRRSRAQSVVDKARRTSAAQGNVENLPSTRLERGVVDGRPTLTAIFAKKGGGEPGRLDLSYLLDFPGLVDHFAEGMLGWGRSLKNICRNLGARRMRGNWFTYLAEQGLSELLISELDEQVMAGFDAWLHRKLKADGKPLHPNSIRKELGALRSVLRNAPGAGQFLDLVPAGPRGASRKTEPTAVLQFDQLVMVMGAVEEEVLALRDRWEEGRRLLAQGRRYLEQGQTLCRNPRGRSARADANVALALAMLDLHYSGVIPDHVVIEADHPLLAATIRYAVGSLKANSYFFANARDLVPLALSVAIATVFNPDTVLTLKWKAIDRNVDRLSNGCAFVQFDVRDESVDEEEVAIAEASGTPLTKVTGDKSRARRPLVRLLDPQTSGPNQVSLNLVLDLLAALTTRIRPSVIDPEQHGDRVFLFVQKNNQKRPKGFGHSSQTASGDTAWKTALSRFISEKQLPGFTLKTIRSTLLDYTQLFKRGDLEAARQVGNHSSRVITWTHYTSNLVRRLLRESIGETMLVRERWLQSDGRLDPRKFREWTDKGCATPGWTCLDPFDSPRHNQKKGSLCTAYGECPDCPLAAARPDNSQNVMLYEALRRAIYRSVTRVTAAVWRERWAPVVTALDALLTHVPTQILEESRRFSIELPDIG